VETSLRVLMIHVATTLANNRMKLTKRPRGATVGQTGGAACAFAHRAFRSLSGCSADAEGARAARMLMGVL